MGPLDRRDLTESVSDVDVRNWLRCGDGALSSPAHTRPTDDIN